MYQWLDPVGRVYNQGNLLETENTQQELIRRVASVIRAALTLLGIIFVVLIVYAGARWMTARGNEDLVQTARDTLQNAGIGLVIIIASYALTATIISLLLRETTS
jgi:putative copper export protein